MSEYFSKINPVFIHSIAEKMDTENGIQDNTISGSIWNKYRGNDNRGLVLPEGNSLKLDAALAVLYKHIAHLSDEQFKKLCERIGIGTNGTTNPPNKINTINLQEEYPELPFNKEGNIDFDEFTEEKLRAKYPESDYDIETNHFENDEYITVRNKKDNKWILTFAKATNVQGEKLQMINFEHNGIPTNLCYQDGKFARRTICNSDETINTIEDFDENGKLTAKCIYNNGKMSEREKFDKNGELVKKFIYKEDDTGYTEQDFSNGIICREITYTITENGISIIGRKNILADELSLAIANQNSEKLKEALSKVNKDNVEFVLDDLYNCTNGSCFSDFSDKLYPQLFSILGNDAEKYITKFKNAMIESINNRGGYTKDLVKDFNSEPCSYTKSAIDFTRLLNRCQGGHNSEIEGKPDGKIDTENVKQGGTGDCWLIASILSATNKNKKGLDYINSMLSVDSNGNVTVELKGANRKYIISAEEIEKSNHLASGDPDMRAIEIAVDRFMKENAYITSSNNYDFSHADINGDWMNLAYNIIFGNGYYYGCNDILNDDFNNENEIYTLSFDNNPDVKATILGSSEQNDVNLIGRHAYVIKKSDKKYIYLINPHNSSETIRVERKALQTKNPKIYFAQIDPNIPCG